MSSDSGTHDVYGESPNEWGLKGTVCNSCTIVCKCAHLWPFGPFRKGNFRRRMTAIVGNCGQLRTSALSPYLRAPNWTFPSEFRVFDGTKTSDLCSAMCIAGHHLYHAMHLHCDLRSCCRKPLRCRQRCKHGCECDAVMWWT